MDHTNKWVITLSNTPLTNEQLSLLQKGPSYAIIPKYPPIEAYITATETTILQTTSPGSAQPQPFPMQNPYPTKTGQLQGGTHSR